MYLTDLGDADAPAGLRPLFETVAFATPWRRLERLCLPPGASWTMAGDGPDNEHGLLLLGGALEVRAHGPGTVITAALDVAPAWLVGQPGGGLQVANRGPAGALVLHLEVAAEGGRVCSAAAGSLAATALAWRPAIHGGCGRVATRHVLPPGRFASPWTFLDHTVLGPDSSLGLHYHEALEESFVVLRGHGYMTAAAQTRPIGPGGATFQPIGTPHGLYCPGPDELEFVRLAVAAPGAPYSTIDLHDDLRTHRPAGSPPTAGRT
jgi:hypothetical protein